MFGEIEGCGFEVIDPSFCECFVGHASVERLWSGARWSEGPVWFAAGRYLVWSDIPNNRMMRWDETSGVVSEIRVPSNNSNGNTIDRQGRMVTCEHCLNPDGKLIGKIRIPEMVANVTFGGAKRNRLFICGTSSLYSAYLTISGSRLA